MVRAVYRDGVIYPLDPIPPEWASGQELRVELMDPFALDEEEIIDPAEFDQWAREVNEAAAQLDDPEHWAQFERNLAEADRIAKDQMRREMGLP